LPHLLVQASSGGAIVEGEGLTVETESRGWAEALAVISQIAPLITSISILFAGAWGLYTYRKQVRGQASKWTVDLYQDFYKDPVMKKARELVEFDYAESLKFLLQKRVLNREIPLTKTERANRGLLDYFLNYLEQLRYLESAKVLSRADSSTFFAYWFSILMRPEYSALRRYLARCGYERLAEDFRLDDVEHVIFYGTLMRSSPRQDQLDLRGKVSLVSEITITGQMYELPTCPGFMTGGTNSYLAEVYRVTDQTAFASLDTLEEYDASDHSRSRFIRESVWVPKLSIDAWIYILSPAALPESAPLITHRSWEDFVEATGKKLPTLPPAPSFNPPQPPGEQ